MADSEIFNLIEKEKARQTNGLELIASENFVSNDVINALGSILTNKYAEGLPGKRYYGGCEVVDEIENLAIERVKTLFNAEWANVQPHSGSQANAAVMLALLEPGDTILGFNLSHGGHLTHGSPVNFSGKLYNPVFYGVEKETGLIDYEQLEQTARKVKPKLIVCGASAYSRDWDYERFRAVADEVGALLMADISHPAGLIARGLLNDPLPHCHVVTTTTHKTLRGPRGGIILVGNDGGNTIGKLTKSGKKKRWSTLLDSGVFPGTQGGPLEHCIAAKAVAFKEALSDDFVNYIVQVVKNAKRLSEALNNKGYNIISGGTDNHCMLIDLQNKGLTGKTAEETLIKADITVNKNMVPFDPESPIVTSGIRIGTAAMTTRGLVEDDMETVADWINDALNNHQNMHKIEEVKEAVNKKMSSLPLFNLS